jgi:integrase
MMPSKRLTEEGVRKLKPPPRGKQIDFFDQGMPGLVLRVNYGGRKTWRALYYVKGTGKDGTRRTEPRTYPLGLFPILNLMQAREKARRFLDNPQKALAQADTGTFKEEAENFIKRHVEANKLRSRHEIIRCLTKYVYPRWQHRPFHELKRQDVATLLDQIEDDHGKRQADMVLAILSKLMHWHETRNNDYVSPIIRGMGRYSPADRRGKRILDDDEIRALWKACDDAGTFGALVKTLLLTAQRKSKVATMKWTDLKGEEWTIASEPREKTNAGILVLPKMALDIINAQPRIAGNPCVFAAAHGEGAFNSFSQGKGELDEANPKMPPWVLHDLRRTARSLMSRAEVRPDIAERVLGHAIPGVEGVYDRHSYRNEKADALTKLAALIDNILTPPEGKVTSMVGRRTKTAR